MPLDLSNEDLFAETMDLEQARLKLTDEGWNAEGKYLGSTWIRIRYILGVYREEILEHPFRSATVENNMKLK